jgi:hypothetical protein
VIGGVRLVEKRGGKSGVFVAAVKSGARGTGPLPR